MPETRGADVGNPQRRDAPGSSLMIARGDAFRVTMLTSGGSGGADEATLWSLQPERRTAAPKKQGPQTLSRT